MKKLDLVAMLMNIRKDWTLVDYNEAYGDEWTKVPSNVKDCQEMMEEYISATYDIKYITECIQNEIAQIQNIYDAKIKIINEASEEKLAPMYRDYLESKKETLVGITFSTGNIDDMYEVKEVVEDNGTTLIVFQTWEGEDGETDGIGIDELNFGQLQEMFDEISKSSS